MYCGTEMMVAWTSVLGLVAAGTVADWRRVRYVAAVVVGAAALVLLARPSLHTPLVSQYKMLSYVLDMPETKVIHHDEGPLGRIDVVEGPAIHHAPGLSLAWMEQIPPHVLLIIDGDAATAVYDAPRREDWAFLDYTTGAAPYCLRRAASVCVVGAGGGSDIALAKYHGAKRVVALEMNGQVISAMEGPLAERGGRIYQAPGVEVIHAEARGFFSATHERFDVIQLPEAGAFGASGAGLYAAQESYLYTVESVSRMLDALTDDGVLCMTQWARTPPRAGLRALDLVAEALRSKGLSPAPRLAMIRSWATVTVLASKSPLRDAQTSALRRFCEARSFDLCYLPSMTGEEANRFHVLDRAYYFEGAEALLSKGREAYLRDYLFEVEAPTDDKPYFQHFFRFKSLPVIREQLGGRFRTSLELGYLMLLASLAQGVAVAAVLILLPLAPFMKDLRRAPSKAATFAYVLLLGVGFMLLEMGFLQKLILYLARPIYSAAVVIAAFLVFAGVGSELSRRWRASARRVASVAALVVVVSGTTLALFLDDWLALTQSLPLWTRMLVAALTIAPPAVAMGHMFPSALRLISSASPALVPWAWGINGFASVVATVSAPLLAMYVGFRFVVFAALGCYFLAGLLARVLPGPKPGAAIGGTSREREGP
ncbi:SAM-dependent methyltransferase [Methanosarcinales archaeon]|nr:MAG: SAM-dependent methyltransferase [Methanosarcinales archaeon]